MRIFLLLFMCTFATALSADAPAITVESDAADYQNQNAILSGNVKIKHPLGLLQAGQAVIISQKSGGIEQIQLSDGVFIHLNDGTTLQCAEAILHGEKDRSPTIHCLSSETIPCQLVYQENSTVNCHEATAFLSKTGPDEHLAIVKIQASGDIRLRRSGSANDPLNGYASGDTMTYDVQKQEVSLTALPGKRVLVFDALKNSKMSAGTIVIKKQPATGKELIQAKGNVRLIFDR